MPKTKYGTPFVPKTITIRKDQADFVENKSINLSKLVQKSLDKEMGIDEPEVHGKKAVALQYLKANKESKERGRHGT